MRRSVAAEALEGAHPRRHRIGPEQAADQQAIDVDEAAHDPRCREEEDRTENEDGHVLEEPGRAESEGVRRKEGPRQSPHRGAASVAAEDGVEEAGEGVPPQAERHQHAEDRPGYLQGEIAHGAPGHAVAQARLEPAQEAGPPRERLGVLHRLVEHVARQAAREPADATCAAQRQRQHREAEEGDGQDETGHHGERDEGQSGAGEGPTQKEEGQLGPHPFRERLVQNGVRQLLGPDGLLFGHGERQLASPDPHPDAAVLVFVRRHASFRLNTNAPRPSVAAV
jgi:hypothetical protein